MINANGFIDFYGKNFPVATSFRSTTVDEVPEQIGSTVGRVIFGYILYNPNNQEVFVKFYNKATSPAVGTDIPINAPLIVPARGEVVFLGYEIIWSFSSAAWIVAVTGAADSNSAAPTSDLMCQVFYR